MRAANDNTYGASIRFPVLPRLVPPTKAARRLHLTLSEFEHKRAALHRAGFPEPCSVTGHYDLLAIDGWLDRRAGISAEQVETANALQLVNERLAALG